MNSLQTLTVDQFNAALEAVTKDIVPAEVPTQTVLTQLMAYRPTLLAYRKKGYSVRQLVAFLADPRIGIKASRATVQRALGTNAKRRPASAPAAKPARSTPAQQPAS